MAQFLLDGVPDFPDPQITLLEPPGKSIGDLERAA
jgi:hypothetical protein